MPETDCSNANKDYQMPDAMFEDSIIDTVNVNEDQKLDDMYGINIIDCTKVNKDQEVNANLDVSSTAADMLNETEDSEGDTSWKTMPTLNISNIDSKHI